MGIGDELKKMFSLSVEEKAAPDTKEGVEGDENAGAFPPAGKVEDETRVAEGAADSKEAEEKPDSKETPDEAGAGAEDAKTASLEAQIKKLEDLVVGLQGKIAAVTEEEEPDAIPALVAADVDFIPSDDEFNTIISDRKQLNAAFNKAKKAGSVEAVEHMTKVLPTLITKIATQQANTMYHVNRFWETNKDLQAVPDAQNIASEMYTDLEKANPLKDMKELLGMLAVEMRKKHVKQGQPPRQKPPTNPGAGTARGAGNPALPPAKKSSLKDEINELKKVG